jgi:hypothetical protein
VLCDRVYDALVLPFFERQREEGERSKEWMELQARKKGGWGDEGIESVGWREGVSGGWEAWVGGCGGGKSSRLFESTLSSFA